MTEIPILYHDDDMLVVSKPGGMAVHRGMGVPRTEPFVLQTVAAQVGRHLYPVHRLDRPTSGVLAFALSSSAAAALQAALQDPQCWKEYVVLCRGETPEQFESDRSLKNDRGDLLAAHSAFTRLATFERCSLLRVRITTGRHHQIRRHLAHMAHQVIGDSSRGKGRINAWFRETYGLPRMFVHATRLVVAHPRDGRRLEIDDPLPPDLRAFLERIPSADRGLIASL